MSLHDHLAELANPAPLLQIYDEDANTENLGTLVDFNENDDSDGNNMVTSVLRAKNTQILADSDARYLGKRISREKLRELQGQHSESDDSGSYEESASEDDDYGDREEDMEEEDAEEASDLDEDEESSPVPAAAARQESGTSVPSIRTFSTKSSNEEREKGNDIKAQLNLYDVLVECRIRLQKAISLANQLPQFDTWPVFNKKGGNLFFEVSNNCRNSSTLLLDKLFSLQTDLLAQNPETKFMAKGMSKLDDNSINTSREMESHDRIKRAGVKRKIEEDEYPEILKKMHLDMTKYRNSTIKTWYQRVSISSVNNSFKGFERPTLKQIEQILNDSGKLIRRTQLRRIPFTVLGKTEKNHETPADNDISDIKDLHLQDYDPEIFEDNDFYHHNLREIIERRAVSASEPSALGKQFLEIQKLRSKLKRKVNTGASKGRKIRFDVIPKLVNFMAPYDDSQMTDEAKNDLFNSLLQ